jgi:hypothetical protein
MKVLVSFDLDIETPIHFLPTTHRQRGGRIDKVRSISVMPNDYRLILCPEPPAFYVWFECEPKSLMNVSVREQHIVNSVKKRPIISGKAIGMNTARARIEFTEPSDIPTKYLKAFVYRAFGHQLDALHEESLQVRRVNPKFYFNNEFLGTCEGIIELVNRGGLNELF